jgi:hypothetical protein
MIKLRDTLVTMPSGFRTILRFIVSKIENKCDVINFSFVKKDFNMQITAGM